MQLAEEKKELKGSVTVLEAEDQKVKTKTTSNPYVLLQKLKSLQTNILTGEVVKEVEMKIIDLRGGDGIVTLL